MTIGGRQGYLTYLAAGRAKIDYNHPMAGKTLILFTGKELKVMMTRFGS